MGPLFFGLRTGGSSCPPFFDDGTYEICIEMIVDGLLVFRGQDRLQFLSFFFFFGDGAGTGGTG